MLPEDKQKEDMMPKTPTKVTAKGVVKERVPRGALIYTPDKRSFTHFCDNESPLKCGDAVTFIIEDGWTAVEVTILP